MFRLKIVPQTTRIPFIGMRNITFALTVLLSLGSLLLFFTKLKGICITPADLGRIRGIVSGLGLGDVQAQTFGADNAVLIRLEQHEGGEQAQQAAVTRVKEALDRDYGAPLEYRRIELVGPKVSGDLVNAGVLAVVLAVGAMLVYVWFRFEWQFGVGALFALVHDVTLVPPAPGGRTFYARHGVKVIAAAYEARHGFLRGGEGAGLRCSGARIRSRSRPGPFRSRGMAAFPCGDNPLANPPPIWKRIRIERV